MTLPLRMDVLYWGDLKQRLQSALAMARDKKPVMEAVGRVVTEQNRKRFLTGTAPNGERWPPVLRGGQPLRDKGVHLMNPLHYKLDGPDSVLVGVPHKWAAVHQFGATIVAKNAPLLRFRINGRWVSKKSVTIPARPFLGLNSDDREAVKIAIAGIVRAQLRT